MLRPLIKALTFGLATFVAPVVVGVFINRLTDLTKTHNDQLGAAFWRDVVAMAPAHWWSASSIAAIICAWIVFGRTTNAKRRNPLREAATRRLAKLADVAATPEAVVAIVEAGERVGHARLPEP